MNSDSAIERAIDAAGGLSALSRKLGDISPQAIFKWRRGGVPSKRVIAVERVTGITRHELRPDLYPIEGDTNGKDA
jgi:DNA-binding transcriptional regulator YdaS (Cro superfamily)